MLPSPSTSSPSSSISDITSSSNGDGTKKPGMSSWNNFRRVMKQKIKDNEVQLNGQTIAQYYSVTWKAMSQEEKNKYN
jgi:hypothetical protein